jgi:hypothetical protein
MDWIHMVSTRLNLRVPSNVENFLNSSGTVSFSRRTRSLESQFFFCVFHFTINCLYCARDLHLFVLQIKQITLELLTIIRQTENDDMTSVMQKLVCTYTEQLMPIAVEICRHLVTIKPLLFLS